MLRSLLLNSSYEPLSLISERTIYRLLLKEKVEVLSTWDEEIKWTNGKIKIPSVVRMKYHIKIPNLKVTFSRRAVFIRDNFCCAYCNIALTYTQATWDHILPTTRGGKSEWLNCVTACQDCNWRKGNQTPEEAKMALLWQPFVPRLRVRVDLSRIANQHPDWQLYVR